MRVWLVVLWLDEDRTGGGAQSGGVVFRKVSPQSIAILISPQSQIGSYSI